MWLYLLWFTRLTPKRINMSDTQQKRIVSRFGGWMLRSAFSREGHLSPGVLGGLGDVPCSGPQTGAHDEGQPAPRSPAGDPRAPAATAHRRSQLVIAPGILQGRLSLQWAATVPTGPCPSWHTTHHKPSRPRPPRAVLPTASVTDSCLGVCWLRLSCSHLGTCVRPPEVSYELVPLPVGEGGAHLLLPEGSDVKGPRQTS